MRKTTAALSAALLALAYSPAIGQDMIATFEDDTVWTVAGNDIDDNAATAQIAVDNDDFTQGSGSIVIDYDYSGNAAFEIGITKEFDPPMDLSEAQEFAIDVKGDASSEQDIQWYAVMTDVHGQSIKYYMGSGYTENTIPVHRPKDGEWMTYTFSLAELVWQEWGNTAYRPPSLSEVESVTFYLQQVSDIEDPGSTTVHVDNWRYSTSTDRMMTVVSDDFDYTSTAEMLETWSENFSGGPNEEAQSEPSLNTTNVFAGTGAMQLDFELTGDATNWSTGQRAPQDPPGTVEDLDVFEIAIAGDPDIPDTVTFSIDFEDSDGNRFRWRANNALLSEQYDRLVLFTERDVATEWGAVRAWENVSHAGDPEEELDLTDIVSVRVSAIDSGSDFPWTGTVLVDNFLYHIPLDEDIESPAEATATRDWTIYR